MPPVTNTSCTEGLVVCSLEFLTTTSLPNLPYTCAWYWRHSSLLSPFCTQLSSYPASIAICQDIAVLRAPSRAGHHPRVDSSNPPKTSHPPKKSTSVEGHSRHPLFGGYSASLLFNSPSIRQSHFQGFEYPVTITHRVWRCPLRRPDRDQVCKTR